MVLFDFHLPSSFTLQENNKSLGGHRYLFKRWVIASNNNQTILWE
jgi:hypothetical protein